MRTQVLDTSIDCYHSMNGAHKATVCDSIYSIVAESKKALSLREIQSRYEILFGEFIDVSTVSGRVNELISAKRLERKSPKRKCIFSGKTVRPVSIVPFQLRLV